MGTLDPWVHGHPGERHLTHHPFALHSRFLSDYPSLATGAVYEVAQMLGRIPRDGS